MSLGVFSQLEPAVGFRPPRGPGEAAAGGPAWVWRRSRPGAPPMLLAGPHPCRWPVSLRKGCEELAGKAPGPRGGSGTSCITLYVSQVRRPLLSPSARASEAGSPASRPRLLPVSPANSSPPLNVRRSCPAVAAGGGDLPRAWTLIPKDLAAPLSQGSGRREPADQAGVGLTLLSFCHSSLLSRL